VKTIRRRLAAGLACATILCTGGAAAVLYRTLLEESNELADLQLRQLAAALPDEAAAYAGPVASDPEEQFALQAWNGAGELVHAVPLAPHAPLPRQDLRGFATRRFAGAPWRLYGVRRHDTYIQVAQPIAVRERLAAAMTLRAGLPLLAAVALLAALAVAIVRAALRPLGRLADALADRSPSTLGQLAAADWPLELVPIVAALDSFLERFAHALTAQQTFVADAAHELRSPLTALKLQLQLAERETGAEERRAAMARLHARLDRGSHLVEQLLSLATHGSGYAAARMARIDPRDLLERTVADHAVLAEQRGIDLGLGVVEAAPLLGHRDGIQCMLNNLVDNALRYTPRGGRVDVSARRERGGTVLVVADDGPGIAAQHMTRVFDRFFRPDGQEATGCGLGLSIVRNIADHHRARVVLLRGPGGQGLVVEVRFPPGAPA